MPTQLSVDGSVNHRDSSTETVHEVSERLVSPRLSVDRTAITFERTAAGRPSFQIITISQSVPNTPVMLTTDRPDCFQLACDSQPDYVPSLTLTPSPAGTYVHLRYVGSQPGLHTGQLLIQRPDETQTIALNGHTTGFFPVAFTHIRRPVWTALAALTVAGGLAWSGYTNHCLLFPDLCQETTSGRPAKTVPPVAVPVPAKAIDAHKNEPVATVASRQHEKAAVQKTDERVSEQPLSPKAAEGQPVALSHHPVDRPVSRNLPAKPLGTRSGDQRPHVRETPATEESDLERELNKPTQHQ